MFEYLIVSKIVILQNKLITLLNEVLNQNAKLRKGGTQALYYCPICNHYKRKLEISIDDSSDTFGKYHCWVCHFKGSYLGSLLTKIKAPNHYREKLFELTKDVRLLRKFKTKSNSLELQLPKEFVSLAYVPPKSQFHVIERREYSRAIKYLMSRQITEIDIIRYNLGICYEGEYKDCIVVPSYDDEGKLNYFSSRCYYPDKWLTYKNAPGSKNIVGFELFVNYNEPITLVEGVFDAIAVRNNAIPLFGTMMSQRLKESLFFNKTPRVNVALDEDAIDEALKIIEQLTKLGICTHLIKLEEKDPSILGFEKMMKIIDSSKQFEFEDLVYQHLL